MLSWPRAMQARAFPQLLREMASSNISANARRTFIEVTDDSSIEFLKKIAEFIEEVSALDNPPKYNMSFSIKNQETAKKELSLLPKYDYLVVNLLNNHFLFSTISIDFLIKYSNLIKSSFKYKNPIIASNPLEIACSRRLTFFL